MTLRRRAKGYQRPSGVAILVWRGAWIWFWSIPRHAVEHDAEADRQIRGRGNV